MGDDIMAMELLFENQTQMDEAVIHHIIEKNYKKNSKKKTYHILALLIGMIATVATVYAGYLSVATKDMTTIMCTVILLILAIYSFYIFFKNTTKNQIKAFEKSVSKELFNPRRIKVYNNIIYQSSGKSHAEYKPFQFTEIESWEHYFLLHYGNGYVVIDKNGFTTGTPEDFEAYMHKKISGNC
jgi:hypothetical protein